MSEWIWFYDVVDLGNINSGVNTLSSIFNTFINDIFAALRWIAGGH